MKKWVLTLLALILLAAAANAKCGDNFCDYGEDCTTCPDDCLCTKDKHDEQVNCTISFDSQECEKGYCRDRWCSTLEGFQSIYKKATCSDNGSIDLEVKFQELDSIVLTPAETLKVYIREKNDESSFEEISGTWLNPSMQGESKNTKIRDTSYFTSENNLFKTKGDYYVRVKYQMGRSNMLFEDELVSCPGMATAPEPETEEAKPEEQIKEETTPPEETPEEAVEEIPEETPKEEVKEETPEVKPEEKSSTIWYIIGGVIALVAIIFFVKYEIKIIRKNAQQKF
ncbi:MAG: hypothetical protein Q8N77_06200 [Nanoarchaeota archaeon]|nr:hypothetical protein [Nanoarchaeota archaeon]